MERLDYTGNDESSHLRSFVVDLCKLDQVFTYVPDKKQAWKYLIKLTKSEDYNVRSRIANLLGSVFRYVPDKKRPGKM